MHGKPGVLPPGFLFFMDKAYICGPMATVISLQEFTALYTEYSRRFTDIAFSYLQDRQEAEDVVSESFMAFWTGRENAPLAQHLPSYILGIVKHKCMDTLRSRESTDRRCRNIYQQACRDAKVRVLGNDELTQQLFRGHFLRIPRRGKDLSVDRRRHGHPGPHRHAGNPNRPFPPPESPAGLSSRPPSSSRPFPVGNPAFFL